MFLGWFGSMLQLKGTTAKMVKITRIPSTTYMPMEGVVERGELSKGELIPPVRLRSAQAGGHTKEGMVIELIRLMEAMEAMQLP